MCLTIDLKRTTALIWLHGASWELQQRDGSGGIWLSQNMRSGAAAWALCMCMCISHSSTDNRKRKNWDLSHEMEEKGNMLKTGKDCLSMSYRLKSAYRYTLVCLIKFSTIHTTFEHHDIPRQLQQHCAYRPTNLDKSKINYDNTCQNAFQTFPMSLAKTLIMSFSFVLVGHLC